MVGLAVLISVAIGEAALADLEELPARTVAQGSASEAMASEALTPEAVTALQTGPQVYNAVCIACHSPPGIGGAPALGDDAAWAARIAQGKETLIDHALNGFSGSTGIMPRKGGRIDLADEEIIAAIEYMIEQLSQ